MSLLNPQILDPKADIAAATPEIDKSIATLAAALKGALAIDGTDIYITTGDNLPVIVSKAIKISISKKAPA